MSEKINCMIVDDEEMARSILSEFVERTNILKLKHVCSGALEASNILEEDDSVRLIFLDIQMPEMTGIEFVETLKGRNIQIVLVTSRVEYAVEAFEYDVTDYLVKPVKYARFLKAVNKAKENLHEVPVTELPNSTSALFVKTDHRIMKIPFQDILYIEALSDYVIIHTFDKRFIVHSTMKGIEKKMAPVKKFFRVHRSFIVNAEHIETIQDLYIQIGDKSIPVGRSYKNAFYRKLNIV